MRLFGEIEKFEKRDDGTLLVSGVASSEAVDSDGQTVTADAIRNALPDYMRFGNIREMHSDKSAAGVCISADVMPDGKTRIDTLIVDPTAIKKVTTGVYKGFSIGGDVLSVQGKAVTRIKLKEISLCDRPANPETVLDIWKSEKSTKVMIESKMFAKSLGLPETATESEIIDAFTKRTASPIQPNVDEIIAKAIKLAVPDNSSLNATIEKLDKSVKDLTAKSEAADALIQKSERTSIIEQASREGKVIPLTPDEIFGNAEKKIDACPVPLLKSMLSNAVKTVPMGNPRAKVPITTDNNQVEIDIFDPKATLDPKVRSELCKTARARSIAATNEYFQKNSN